jgi:hypothetical protein
MDIKKHIILINILLMLYFPVAAQFPGWSWAKSAGGPGFDVGGSITTDASGNVILGGIFKESITHGGTTLVSNGDYDLYIAKYNSAGNLLWVTSAGGEYRDYVNDVATDKSGNIYITGTFWSSSISFGAITLTNAVPNFASNLFIVKYSPSGELLWAKGAGISDGFSQGYGITTDVVGNVYVTGHFGSTSISFDLINLTNSSSIGVSSFSDIFIVKYSSFGAVLWAISEGGFQNDWYTKITIDDSGNLLVSGLFDSPSLSFGSFVLTNVSSHGFFSDVFIAKYSPSGTWLWATSVGGINDENIHGIDTDASGNVYVTGRFHSPTISFGSTTFVNEGEWDMFTAKYSPGGILVWAKSIGGTSRQHGWGIATEASGDVYVIGSFDSDSIKLDSITLTNSGQLYHDVYIVKYSASGNVIWATSFGGEGFDSGSDISIDASGNIYVTGSFSSDVNFGPIILTYEDPLPYSSEVYLAKIGTINGINNLSLIAYPNPVLNYLTIESDQVIGRIHLYDFLGRKVMDIKVNEKNSILDMSQFSIGIYYLKSEHYEKGIKVIKY